MNRKKNFYITIVILNFVQQIFAKGSIDFIEKNNLKLANHFLLKLVIFLIILILFVLAIYLYMKFNLQKKKNFDLDKKLEVYRNELENLKNNNEKESNLVLKVEKTEPYFNFYNTKSFIEKINYYKKQNLNKKMNIIKIKIKDEERINENKMIEISNIINKSILMYENICSYDGFGNFEILIISDDDSDVVKFISTIKNELKEKYIYIKNKRKIL